MASIVKEISTTASVDAVWAALRDVGALHTRLVPGFVVDTRLEPGARIVTFANGAVARELIVDINEETKRIVWSARSELFTHHNASAQVFKGDNGQSRIVWIADLLPNKAADVIAQMMEQGINIMKATLDGIAARQ